MTVTCLPPPKSSFSVSQFAKMVELIDVASEYTDVHRCFLQACVSHGTQSIPQALNVLTHIREKHGNNADAPAPNEQDLRQLVVEINAKLAILEQKLDFVLMDVETFDEFLVFKSESHSAAIEFPTEFTADERKYFELIIENIIVHSHEYSLSAIYALNLTAGLKVTKLRAEEIMELWSAQGYLFNIDGVIQPGPRLISEFGDVLRTQFREYVRSCFLCKHIIFKGENCQHCDCVIHKRCSVKYFAKAKRCPKCRQE